MKLKTNYENLLQNLAKNNVLTDEEKIMLTFQNFIDSIISDLEELTEVSKKLLSLTSKFEDTYYIELPTQHRDLEMFVAAIKANRPQCETSEKFTPLPDEVDS